MLQKKFIPVAIDQFRQRQQKDAEGEFWRKIAGQSPRNDFDDTTQGLFIASASGELFTYNNNRGPKRIKALMEAALKKHLPEKDTPILDGTEIDSRFLTKPPQGTTVIRVHAKVLGRFAEPENAWQAIFQKAVSRDNLWITDKERAQLAQGTFSDTLAQRIARYHLVDNTRGEPSFWKPNDVKTATFQLDKSGNVSGSVHMERADHSSGYEADLLGHLTFTGDQISRFDLVAKGDYWGRGRYTKGAPEGRFPFGVSFRLTNGDSPFDSIPPQGTKGWWKPYFGDS